MRRDPGCVATPVVRVLSDFGFSLDAGPEIIKGENSVETPVVRECSGCKVATTSNVDASPLGTGESVDDVLADIVAGEVNLGATVITKLFVASVTATEDVTMELLVYCTSVFGV